MQPIASSDSTTNTTTVFVSYARRDKKHVKPVVKLLSAFDLQVFRDEESIKPGSKWEVVLLEELEDAKIVLVFWSKAAASSNWVKKEYARAAELAKRIVPVLLDATGLPPTLSTYQAVDFQEVGSRILSSRTAGLLALALTTTSIAVSITLFTALYMAYESPLVAFFSGVESVVKALTAAAPIASERPPMQATTSVPREEPPLQEAPTFPSDPGIADPEFPFPPDSEVSLDLQPDFFPLVVLLFSALSFLLLWYLVRRRANHRNAFRTRVKILAQEIAAVTPSEKTVPRQSRA